MAPLHAEVLTANPDLQPIYDMVQEYNAKFAAAPAEEAEEAEVETEAAEVETEAAEVETETEAE
jgi:hypothetical protein